MCNFQILGPEGDYNAAKDFIFNLFDEIRKGADKDLYAYFTCATGIQDKSL